MRRLALLGWNDNTQRCLDALAYRQRVPSVVVVPAGVESSALQAQARGWGIEVRVADRQTALRTLLPDIALIASASWPLKISAEDIAAFPDAIINVHGAALPRWRGPHPLNWALLADDPTIGVTVHHVAVGLDEGDIILQQTLPLNDEDTLLDVRALVHRAGAALLADAVARLDRGDAPRIPQDPAAATQARRRTPDDGRITWSASARTCFAHIRASGRPTPGAFTHRGDERVTIWRAAITTSPAGSELPGTVLQTHPMPIVRTGDGGALALLEWEGPTLAVGDRLASPTG
ncbi:MAG: hypothetical protein K2R93_07095 [Gemmatimonadaceae bacterium]|nr:hypothetical protein [Gemmatimonadaceae bacterium]